MTEHERFINEYCMNVENIKIRCDDCKFVEDCVDYGWDGCKKFTPKQSEPMTNEEWFTSLSTEEKAKRIINIAVNSDCDYRTIVEWLKQPHTNE